jgi:hypothetical protein
VSWKAGDTTNLPVRLEDAAGTGLVYADAVALLAAGWTVIWYQSHVALGTQPTFTLWPRPDGIAGEYLLEFVIPSGCWVLAITPPTGTLYSSTPAAVSDSATTEDVDDLFRLLSLTQGTMVSTDRVAQYDWDTVEGDSFSKLLQVPAAALSDFGFSTLADLSAGAWTVSAQARKGTNPPSAGAADFSLIATVTDKVLNIVRIALAANTPNATIDYASGSTQAFLYDVQLHAPYALTITAASIVGLSFTVAGDQRLLLAPGQTITITGGPNAGSRIIAAGAASVAYDGTNTVITVTVAPASNTAGGSIAAFLSITCIEGTITVQRQETTP